MKVIFLEDIPNVGRAGETKEVADGYGRNFLIPRRLAVLADAMASNVVEAQLKKIARRQAETEAEMVELAGKLDGKGITLKAKAGAKDRLYGSITSTDVADEISHSLGLVVDKRKIELDEPIRELGDYEITIRLTKDIMPRIKLAVVSEEEKEEKKAKAEEKEEKKAKAEEKGEKKAKAEEKEEKKAKPKKKVKAEKKEDKVEEAKEEEKAKPKKKVKAEKKEDKAEEAKAEETKEETK